MIVETCRAWCSMKGELSVVGLYWLIGNIRTVMFDVRLFCESMIIVK